MFQKENLVPSLNCVKARYLERKSNISVHYSFDVRYQFFFLNVFYKVLSSFLCLRHQQKIVWLHHSTSHTPKPSFFSTVCSFDGKDGHHRFHTCFHFHTLDYFVDWEVPWLYRNAMNSVINEVVAVYNMTRKYKHLWIITIKNAI